MPSLKRRLQQVVNQELNTISDKTHTGNRGVDSLVFLALYGSKRAIWGGDSHSIGVSSCNGIRTTNVVINN